MLDVVGDVFGRLTVVAFAGKNRHDRSAWHCRCECGTEKVLAGSDLRSGKIISCGCARRERTIAPRITHGLKKHPLYQTWAQMKARCLNPRSKAYPEYGGRGIKVCDRWLLSFKDWLADVGERPARGMTIDRENNDGDYEPSNVRWATKSEQARNTRQTILVEWNGAVHRLPDLADRFGIKPSILRCRVYMGWDLNRALTTPPRAALTPIPTQRSEG